MTKRLLPSLLNANWAAFGEDARAVISAGADGLHLDVMDNHYVPNLTFGPTLCRDLKKSGVNAFMDVHLMVEPVSALVDMFIDAGADRITFHADASQDVQLEIKKIKQAGLKVGLALNPKEPLEQLKPFIKELDYVLLMSVQPGFGGQGFIETVRDKAVALRQWLDNEHLQVMIGMDGGIHHENIKDICALGVDDIIVGSAIFKADSSKQYVENLKQLMA